MVAFIPASDVWTLGYDELDDICWRHNKTQELYYVPRGQPLILPPRSLANAFRPNPPDRPPLTPAATARSEAFPVRVYGETVHLNSVPKAAMVWPAFFVGSTQPRVYPPNQWLPSRNFPNDIPAVTACAEASPQQGGGEGVHFNNNSALKVPETARIGAASLADDTKSHLLKNAPRSNIPNDPSIIPAATTRPKDSLLRGGVDGGQLDNASTLEVPEPATVGTASTVEDTKPHPCSSMSRTEDVKNGLTRKSLMNSPRKNIPPEPNDTPTDNDHAKASRIRSGDEPEESHNDSAPGVPVGGRVRPVSTVEDTTPHPCSPMSSTEHVSHELTRKTLANATRPILSHEEAYRVQGGSEGKESDNDSALEVPVAGRLQPISTVEDTKPPSSSTEHVSHGLTRKSLANASQPSLSNQPHLIQTNEDGTKASPLRFDRKGEELDNDSTLDVPEAARVPPASTVEDTKPYLCSPMSWADDVKHGLTRKSLENALHLSVSHETGKDSKNKDRAKTSRIPGGGEGKQFDNDSTLEIHQATRVPQVSTVEDTKPNTCSPTSRVDDARHALTPKILANTPRPNIPHEPRLPPQDKDSATAPRVRGCGEEEELDHDSALDVPEAARVRSASSPMPTAENARHGLPRKSVQNAHFPNIPRSPSLTPAAKLSAKVPPLRGGDEEGRFNNNSALEVAEAVRVRQASCVDSKLRPSHPLFRAEEAKQWSRERDNWGKEYYLNIITGESQYKKPDCLKKYTCRR